MGKIAALAQREMAGLFYSLVGYIVIALYLAIMGIFFAYLVFIPGHPADMRQLFEFSYIAPIFVVPIMTMGVFSEEYNSGRIEMLRTSPITEFDILMGKFVGAMGFYMALVASTLFYLLMLVIFGHPNYGEVQAGYLGLILMGILFVSVGLFFSALTRHQIIAAMCGMIVLAIVGFFNDIVAQFISGMTSYKPLLYLRDLLQYLSFREHMKGFSQGIVEVNHVFFFLGTAFVFLFATYLVLESRKWR
jgi:ABC-2 type transport system permease protein